MARNYLISIFAHLFAGRRRKQGQLQLHVDALGEPALGTTRQGSKSELAAKIDATGARPGDMVAIDEHGHARVVGRKPEIVVNNSKSTN
ncbi:hypothetical protein [Duganella vulcania]|uniref:Uncharacterized protein n=1 Tax=Duganella vulcania TaxID=2692166 RepID=A0A845GEB2_9BURK|nr:hypothetical protein [Duganella vulcania]MYM92634.1 hypothetical protein [Duganella vulcania]